MTIQYPPDPITSQDSATREKKFDALADPQPAPILSPPDMDEDGRILTYKEDRILPFWWMHGMASTDEIASLATAILRDPGHGAALRLSAAAFLLRLREAEAKSNHWQP